MIICIIDYGLGNLRSVEKALEKSGAEVIISSKEDDIIRSDKLILPGVGAIKDAMFKLKTSGLDKLIVAQAKTGKPIMGICLGMQLLMTRSFEGGEYDALGLIDGDVVRFENFLKVPQVGWNDISIVKNSPLLDGIDKAVVYFVHSYYVPYNKNTAGAVTEYGVKYNSVVIKDNVIGCQFHPEKSGDIGLKLLSNFVKM